LDGVRVVADMPPVDHAVLAESDGVLTGCALAVADTGTFVLDGGRAQGRRALTLVPAHHLCVVHTDQIIATLAEAVERVDPYRPLTWISGPPEGRTLEVLVVED
jgi:L-lactate dehydrogenase complex protein LldG